VGLRPLACWDCAFESLRGQGCLSVLSVVCCQVEVSAAGWSLVQRSPTECEVSECDRESSIMSGPCPTGGGGEGGELLRHGKTKKSQWRKVPKTQLLYKSGLVNSRITVLIKCNKNLRTAGVLYWVQAQTFFFYFSQRFTMSGPTSHSKNTFKKSITKIISDMTVLPPKTLEVVFCSQLRSTNDNWYAVSADVK